MTNEKLESLMEESISESKRTTHAVRAIARLVLLGLTYWIPASAITILGFAVDGGEGDFGAPAVLIGLLLALVGLIHSLSASRSELRLSSAAR
jgi:hypothetical protein